MTRARLITAAAFAGNLGWGAVLPYQYAYVVDARHWGPAAGVLTGTLFCLGAVVSAPFAGRLADRYPAARVAVVAELLAGLAALAMGAAGSPSAFLAAIALFGAAVTAAQPATQVLVLECVEPARRRSAFAYQFTAMALGMAVGSFAAGWFVNLSTPSGMWPAFATAAGGFAVAAVFVWRAGAGAPPVTTGAASATSGFGGAGETRSAPASSPGLVGWPAYRALMASRPVRLLALASALLAAGFYAQFETGLPAFALQSLHVAPSTVGTAAAVNCVVIVALQWLVTKLTGRQPGAVLLAVVGAVWVASWLLLGSALFVGRADATAVFVIAYGVFAVGETMYAPVLSPLAAAVAPKGLVGTTLGAMSALRTGVSAAGPLIAGVLIAARLPHVFVLLHVGINLAAVVVALRLAAAMRGRTARFGRRVPAAQQTAAKEQTLVEPGLDAPALATERSAQAAAA